MNRSVMLKALVLLPVLCFAVVFAQGRSSGNAVAAYVYGGDEMRGDAAEELAEEVVNNLVRSGRYSNPRRGAREFFRAADRAQARARGRMLEDRDFCRIGGDEGVQFLVLIDIAKQGRANSVWARILDLEGCRIIGTAEYTNLIRNTAEIKTAANSLSTELLRRNVGRRSITINLGGGSISVGSAAAPPPPPPPPPRGNQIAAYVFGGEEMRGKLDEDLAEAIVNGLSNSKKYSQPRRGARGFFREVEKEEARLGRRGRLLDDKSFCKIGTDYEIEYLVVIDIEKRGRGNSIWARILDLETCRIIATGESTALVRNDAEVRAVANEIVAELLHRRIGTRR